MFTLPQPETAGEPQDDLPVIPLSEPGEVLDVLLRFCVPLPPPKLDDLTVALRILNASKKYDMEWARAVANDAFAHCADWLVTMVRQSPAIQETAQRDPVAAYLKAHRFGFVEEITLAARLCLRLPLMDILNPDIDSYAFEDIGFKPSSYQRLLRYRINCFEVVRTFIESKAIFSDYNIHGSLNDYRDTLMIAGYCQGWWTSYKPGIIARLKNNTVMGIDGFDLMTSFLDDARRTDVSNTPNLPSLGRIAKQILHFASWMTDEINDLISPVSLELND